jgi:hypothetical protein
VCACVRVCTCAYVRVCVFASGVFLPPLCNSLLAFLACTGTAADQVCMRAMRSTKVCKYACAGARVWCLRKNGSNLFEDEASTNLLEFVAYFERVLCVLLLCCGYASVCPAVLWRASLLCSGALRRERLPLSVTIVGTTARTGTRFTSAQTGPETRRTAQSGKCSLAGR